MQPAEDIVQQAFLGALAALRSGAEVRHLRGWLHQILRNAICDGVARVPDDTVAVQAAYNSLPQIATNPDGVALRAGQIVFPETGTSTVTGCVISDTLQISPFVTTLASGGWSFVKAAPNFAPVAA